MTAHRWFGVFPLRIFALIMGTIYIIHSAYTSYKLLKNVIKSQTQKDLRRYAGYCGKGKLDEPGLSFAIIMSVAVASTGVALIVGTIKV